MISHTLVGSCWLRHEKHLHTCPPGIGDCSNNFAEFTRDSLRHALRSEPRKVANCRVPIGDAAKEGSETKSPSWGWVSSTQPGWFDLETYMDDRNRTISETTHESFFYRIRDVHTISYNIIERNIQR